MKKILIAVIGTLCISQAQAQINIDRTKPPLPGPPPVLRLNDPVIYKMNNGITVLVVEDHRLPKVSASYTIDAGQITEGPKAGVMNLMGEMLGEGTKTMPKAAFDEAVDRIGADVNLNEDGGSVNALTRYFKTAFTLMGQALREPAFTSESFDKLKTKELTNLKSEKKNARAISTRVTAALAFGKTNPAGEFETEETVQNLTLQDVKDAYASYITPSRGYLTFVGDITPAEAKALAASVFGTWRGRTLTLPLTPASENPLKTEIDLIDLPSAVQSEVKVVNLVTLKKGDPDYFPVLMANYILGGGAQSRLFMDLREKHGFTYGAYANTGSGRFQTTFQASASVRTAKTDSALTEIMAQINLIRTQKVTGEELAIAKALYNGSFALNLEDPARTATFASTILINGLPADYYKTYLQKVNAVTTDDVLRVAKKYFNYDNTRIVIVGNAAKILPGLQKCGYPVNQFDIYASPVSAAATVGSAAEKGR